MKKKRNLFLFALILSGSVFCLISIIPKIKLTYDTLFHDWRDDTRPLDKETQKYLCDVFDIGEDKKCETDVEAYSFDYSDDLWEFTQRGKLQTNEEWDQLFGQYKTECEYSDLNILDDGRSYYRCRYDFTGDGISPVLVFFIEDGTYMRHLYSGGS